MSIRRLLPLFFVLALLAAACAAPAEEEAAPAPDTTDDEETTAPDDGETTPADDEETAPADGPYEHLAQAEAGEFSGTTVTIQTQWTEAEAANFEGTIASFADRTGITIEHEPTVDHETTLTIRAEGGNPPDLAQIAQPSSMARLAEGGFLVDISEWTNTDQLATDYSEAWIDLATVDGGVYGVFYKADGKSIVWYPVQGFEDNGYEIPETWDELIALSDQIIADGNGNPWCIGIEQGDVSGWVATDWMEDILLRTAPPETYDAWIAHEIPFNDPEVLEAAEYMHQIWFTPDYVWGGSAAINATFTGDAQNPMFAEAGPECWLHKQAGWIPGNWPEGPVAGEDSRFFYFPPIEEEFGSPVLGSGDMMIMFNDRPEVRAVLEYFATAEAAQGWVEAGGFISPNSAVPTDWYTEYVPMELSAIILGADTFRFDASDLMPAEVGAGTFWTGMVDWVAAGGEGTEEIFQRVEDSWPAE